MNTKTPNGSFAPMREGLYDGICDKGPWHGRWITTEDKFRFGLVEHTSDMEPRLLGHYVYQFGIWVWHDS